MEPTTLIAWVGTIALCVVMAATAIYTVWYLIQSMRGKVTPKAKPSTTVIQNGRP